MILRRPATPAPTDAPGLRGAGSWGRTLPAGMGALLLVGAFFAGVLAYRGELHRGVGERLGVWGRLNYWRSFVPASPLSTLHLDVRFRHLQTLRAKREEALRLGLLFSSDADFVPAQLRFEGRAMNAKIRLKGDWPDHFDTHKWSLRIHLRGEGQVLGMRRFSIQHPKTREYVNEWAFLQNLRLEGLLAPRYYFIRVFLNGEHKGVYALEEFFAREMVEAQGRREGVFLAPDEEVYWARRAQVMAEDRSLALLFDRPGYHLFNLPGYHELLHHPYGAARLARDPVLSRQRDAALGLLQGFRSRTLRASQVFDVALLARYLALAELWSTPHGLVPINSTFYYNPITGRLEPVGVDGQPLQIRRTTDRGQLFALQGDWTRVALEDPEVARVYVKEVRRIASDDYLTYLRNALGMALDGHLRALHREWPDLVAPWSRLRERQALLPRILNPPQIVQALQRLVPPAPRTLPGTSRTPVPVEVANLVALPTEVQGFKVGKRFFPAASTLRSLDGVMQRDTGAGSVVLAPRRPGRPLTFALFGIPWAAGGVSGATADSSIHVLSRLVGDVRVHEAAAVPYPGVARDAAVPPAPSATEMLARHPFLVLSPDASTVRIPAGVWDIKGDLVLPEGMALEIGPGTTLQFAPGAVLLARGPLQFRGLPGQPVILRPRERVWGGIVVLGAARPSLWQDVVVQHTGGIARGGWILTGGITFYGSPVSLHRVKLTGSMAEDAINVIGTSFDFHAVEISQTASDAFDGDFVHGVVRQAVFRAIGGDAIDISGSTVEIRDVYAAEIGDKGISVGEASHASVRRFVLERVGIGIVSKDSSEVLVSDGRVAAFKNVGLAAYRKKPEYGPAGIKAENIVVDRAGRYRLLIQQGSWIVLDGRYHTGTQLDVQRLYEQGVLGN